MPKVKKTLYTLYVDDFAPDMVAITFPLMERYAHKIGADFHIIDTRKFPDKPPVMEKFQLWDLSREHDNDWNIYFDADTLIHPDFFDVTAVLGKDITCSNGTDFCCHRWRPNPYFQRDGRFIGKGNWCCIASDWCRDIWHPLDISYEEAVSNIFPTVMELNTVVQASHLIDDYSISYNIARFGLKHVLIPEIMARYKAEGPHLAHQYTIGIDQKVVWMEKQLTAWGVRI